MIDNGTSMESLREQVIIAQFQGATGCTREQARQLLHTARWEFQTALSMFFQECTIQQQQSPPLAVPAVAMVTSDTPMAQSIFSHQHCRNSVNGSHLGPACAPCNTPATPPNFPEALLALQKLQAGGTDWATAASPPNWQQQQTPKILASFNPMPPPSDRYFQNCDWPTTTPGFQTKTPMAPDHMPKDDDYSASALQSECPMAVMDDPHIDDGTAFCMNGHGSSENNSPPISTNASPSSNPMAIGAFQ